MKHVNDMTPEEYNEHLDNGYDEVRHLQVTKFTDYLIADMERAIVKAGGNPDTFTDYLDRKEVRGAIDDGLHHAFSGVREVIYRGCF